MAEQDLNSPELQTAPTAVEAAVAAENALAETRVELAQAEAALIVTVVEQQAEERARTDAEEIEWLRAENQRLRAEQAPVLISEVSTEAETPPEALSAETAEAAAEIAITAATVALAAEAQTQEMLLETEAETEATETIISGEMTEPSSLVQQEESDAAGDPEPEAVITNPEEPPQKKRRLNFL